MLAFSLAPAQCAHSLKIAEDLGLDMREFRPVEIDLLKPPGQQVRRIRPLAGENREFGPANAQVARDALRFGRTTTIKFRYLLRLRFQFRHQRASRPKGPGRSPVWIEWDIAASKPARPFLLIIVVVS